MARGHGLAPILITAGLVLSPAVTLVAELRGLSSNARPALEPVSFGLEQAPAGFIPPAGARRGRFVPARVIDFRSPSPFVSTFYIHFAPNERVLAGSAVMTPSHILAGRVAKVWPRAGVALVRCVDDPAFRAAASCGGASSTVAGRGEGLGLVAVTGTVADRAEEVVWTSGMDGIFPPHLLIGYVRRGEGEAVAPAFAREGGSWVYAWHDPDIEALEAALGPRAGGG